MALRPDPISGVRLRSYGDLDGQALSALLGEPGSAITALTGEYLGFWDARRTDEVDLLVEDAPVAAGVVAVAVLPVTEQDVPVARHDQAVLGAERQRRQVRQHPVR